MNIFFLHKDPSIAARHHCDKHVLSQIGETTTLLKTSVNALIVQEWCEGPVFTNAKGDPITGYASHPCAIWLQESYANIKWAFTLLQSLHQQYQLRYNKQHALHGFIEEFANTNIGTLVPDNGLTPIPVCMPEWVRGELPSLASLDQAVIAYRNYYRTCKTHFAVWAYSIPPGWWAGYDDNGYMFPNGALFCRTSQKRGYLADQAELMFELEEETGFSSDPVQIAEFFNVRKKRTKKATKKAPIGDPEVERIREECKKHLAKKVPTRKKAAEWIAEFPDKELLNDRVARHIQYWVRHGFGKPVS